MLDQAVSLTETSIIELEIMEKNNSYAVQYVSSSAFLPIQY